VNNQQKTTENGNNYATPVASQKTWKCDNVRFFISYYYWSSRTSEMNRNNFFIRVWSSKFEGIRYFYLK